MSEAWSFSLHTERACEYRLCQPHYRRGDSLVAHRVEMIRYRADGVALFGEASRHSYS